RLVADRQGAQLAKWMRSIEEQIRKLATAARANKTDVRNGYTRWKTSTGNLPSVTIGADAAEDDVAIWCYTSGADGGATYVGETNTGAPPLCRLSNAEDVDSALSGGGGRLDRPLIASAWQQHTYVNSCNRGRPTTPSGTYTTLWRAYLPCTSGGIFTHIAV